MKKLQEAIDDTSLWLFFALVGGGGASMLALGMLLRGHQELTRRAVVGTLLHSMAWGMAVFLMTLDRTSLGIPFTLGVSIFSGMGLASFIDVLMLLLRQRMGVPSPYMPPTTEPRDAQERP